MTHKAPGKHHREGITLVQLMDMFPTEESACGWFESRLWPEGRCCPNCGSARTHEAGHNNMPYRCTDCRAYFSVKTGTVMHKSHIPLRKWAIAIYLHLTSLKGVSSMKLHRDIGVSRRLPGTCFSASEKPGKARSRCLWGRWKWMRPTWAGRNRTSTNPKSSRRAAAQSARPPSSARRTARPIRSRPKSSRVRMQDATRLRAGLCAHRGHRLHRRPQGLPWHALRA